MNRSGSPNTDGIEWKEFYNGYWINNNGKIWSNNKYYDGSRLQQNR